MPKIKTINAIAYSSYRQEIALVDSTSTIWFGEFDTARMSKSQIAIPSRTYSLAYSPDGNIISSASGDGYIRLWDRKNFDLIAEYQNKYSSILSHEFSQDGSILLAIDNVAAYLWDTGEHREIVECYAGCDIISSSIVNNKIILLTDHCGNVYARQIPTGKLLHRISISGGGVGIVTAVAHSTNKDLLILWDTIEVSCWRLDGTFLRKIISTDSEFLSRYNHSPTFGCLSSDASFVVSVDINDGNVLIIDTNSGQLINRIWINELGVRNAILCQQDKYLLTLSYDNTVRLWEIESSLEIRSYQI